MSAATLPRVEAETSKDGGRHYLSLLPALPPGLVVLAFFIVPILMMASISLRPNEDGLIGDGLTFDNYRELVADSYYMVTRMPVAWWWLPVQEHPGDMEVRRAWHVMSAIHNYIATNKDENGNLVVKDDKTGESVPLEFVEMHQPIRHMKKDGQYFACTDFRKPGSKDEYYDIDFWVDDKDGKLQVANVKMHKVPVQEDGIWTQVPRYTFDGMDFDVTN